jgi:signal transduction histidine kinase
VKAPPPPGGPLVTALEGPLFLELRRVQTELAELRQGIENQRQQREAELLGARETAERASRFKSELLANVSHELRTPLNSILGFAEVLADGDFGVLNERQAVYLEHILASGRHLLALINDLLDLAKIEAKGTELELADFDLESLLVDLVSSLASVAGKDGISLASEIEAGMPAIRADARRVRQVVYNLLSNALKFTPAGGRVLVTARRQPAAEGGAVEARFEVSVVDTGIGIGPGDRNRLFQVFEQVGDTSYGRRHHGTGLGLALSRRLVEMHGGRIWAESAGEGEGSTFVFEIPASPEVSAKVG